jgi:hypothetical protein
MTDTFVYVDDAPGYINNETHWRGCMRYQNIQKLLEIHRDTYFWNNFYV